MLAMPQMMCLHEQLRGWPQHGMVVRVIIEWHVHVQDEINGLQQLFRNIDADNSGTITIDELRTALTSCNGKMSVRHRISVSSIWPCICCCHANEGLVHVGT